MVDNLTEADGHLHEGSPKARRTRSVPIPRLLRDTAASLAISTGANVKTVQRMLRHASAAMTLDIYAGLFDDDLDAVSDRLTDAAATAASTEKYREVLDQDKPDYEDGDRADDQGY